MVSSNVTMLITPMLITMVRITGNNTLTSKVINLHNGGSLVKNNM